MTIPQKPDIDKMRAAGWLCERGKPAAGSNRNAYLALKDLDYRFARDDWSRVIRDAHGNELDTDTAIPQLKYHVESAYAALSYSPTKGAVEDAVTILAAEGAYDPVRQRLLALPAPKGRPLDHIGRHAFGTPDTPLQNAQAALLVRGAVVRAIQPGAIFPYIPILYSREQGTSKGDALKLIAPGGFVSGLSTDGFDWEKKAGERVGGRSIAEIPEMEGMAPRELRNAKDLATRTHLDYRAAYDRRLKSHPLQTIIVATTNRRAMLTDDQHRRTPVIEIPQGKAINMRWLRASIQDCWAQVVQEYQAGAYKENGDAAVRMPPALWQAAETNSQAHEVEDGLSIRLQDWLTDVDTQTLTPWVTSAALWDQAQQTGRPSNGEVSRAMTRMGYQNGTRRVDGKVTRGWKIY